MAFPPEDQYSPSRCLVAIHAINLDTNTYGGYNPQMGMLPIRSMVQPGGHVTIPAVGEQWMVEKVAGEWVLYAKTDWNDARIAAIPNEEGLDVVGTMNGPTHLTGSSVTISGDPVTLPSEVALGTHKLRLDPDTGELQTWNGTAWVSTIPDPVAETRDIPAIFRISTNTGVANTATYVTLPLVLQEGNNDYTVDGSGRIVLPYDGWYEVSALIRPSQWSPAPDSATTGWVQVNLARIVASPASTVDLATDNDTKIVSAVSIFSLGNAGFSGVAGNVLAARVAVNTSLSGQSLLYVTNGSSIVTVRWLRGL